MFGSIRRSFRLRLDLGLLGFVSRLFVGVGEHFLVLDLRGSGRFVLRSALRFLGFGEILLNFDTAVFNKFSIDFFGSAVRCAIVGYDCAFRRLFYLNRPGFLTFCGGYLHTYRGC